MRPVCDMVDPHHPDCECVTCAASHDPECGKPAIGRLADGGGLVCEVCCRLMEADGFKVAIFHRLPS